MNLTHDWRRLSTQIESTASVLTLDICRRCGLNRLSSGTAYSDGVTYWYNGQPKMKAKLYMSEPPCKKEPQP